MHEPQERTDTVKTVYGEVIQVDRRKETHFLNQQPVVQITPNLDGTIHLMTIRPGGLQTQRFTVSGATLWDMRYDTPPTKDYAGLIEALLMHLHVMARFLAQSRQGHSPS